MFQARKLMLIALVACAGASAQIIDENPDWRESDVPPAPVFDVKRLIRLESPPGSSLIFGVDPATLSITPEGIVRYVVVASSPGGAQNVMYEGIRCTTAQHRVYARYNAQSGWSQVLDGEWKPLFGSPATRHALTFARAGACSGRAASQSPGDIVRALNAVRPPGYD